MKNKGLFLDLDGTLIITKSGKAFPINADDWEFNQPIMSGVVKFARDFGFKIIIVSNQGGIGKGLVNEGEFVTKIGQIYEEFNKQTWLGITAVYYATSLNAKDPKRKPNPGMARLAELDWNIDLLKSVMVGDASGLEHQFSDSDKMFAQNANIPTYYDVSEFIEKYCK